MGRGRDLCAVRAGVLPRSSLQLQDLNPVLPERERRRCTFTHPQGPPMGRSDKCRWLLGSLPSHPALPCPLLPVCRSVAGAGEEK